MKTVNQIKDDLAKEPGYPSYQEYLEEINGNFYCAERLEKFYDEVIKRTAKEALKNASENALIVNRFGNDIGSFAFDENSHKIWINKQSILYESNIPSL